MRVRPFRDSILLGICVLTLGASVAPSTAADISGKTIATDTGSGVAGSSTLSATILRGKKKHALLIQASATDFSVDALHLCTGNLRLNNLYGVAEPIGFYGTACTLCLNDIEHACTLSFQWVVDLDEAEANHPGVFVNQPVTVAIDVSGGVVGNTSLVVHMEQK